MTPPPTHVPAEHSHPPPGAYLAPPMERCRHCHRWHWRSIGNNKGSTIYNQPCCEDCALISNCVTFVTESGVRLL